MSRTPCYSLFKLFTMITWKMLNFTLLILFFFLRIVFDIFNINFHFCFLKSKFSDGFPSKIPFWLSRTSHENGPFMLHTPSCYATLFTVSHFLSEIVRILSQGIIQEFSLGIGSHMRITICQIFRLLP